MNEWMNAEETASLVVIEIARIRRWLCWFNYFDAVYSSSRNYLPRRIQI